jgi:ATP adenylyltransferase
MERLWRPWRMAYIKGAERHEGCFLCATGSRQAAVDDESNLVLARGEHAFVILNLYPYNTGHLMVAPIRHVGELEDLSHPEVDEIWMWTRRAVAAHRRTTQPHGFNIGINLGDVAGAGVPGHFHQHVVPRWGGDANFMPVLADTKVLPETLADTYRTLRPAFDEIA